MTPKSMRDIGWSWTGHKSSLYWLGILYRRPLVFRKALGELNNWGKFKIWLVLTVHFLPYLFLFTLLLRFGFFEWLQLAPELEYASFTDKFIFYALYSAKGIAGGIAFGIAVGIAVGIAFGIAVGIAFGIAVGIAFGIAFGIAVGIAVGIASGIAEGIAVGIAVTIGSLRLYYHPLFFWLSWPGAQTTLYRYHPVSWDTMCSVPFPGFDRLLVARTEKDPENGLMEIERLIDSYPSQRPAALRAKTMFLARQSARETNLANLSHLISGLPEGKKGFLAETKRLREMVDEISRYQIRLDAIDRPQLQAPYAKALREEIKKITGQVAGFQEPLAGEFRKAAAAWLNVAEEQAFNIVKILDKKPTPQFFRAGDPVNRELEAFIPRDNVLGELQQQILLSAGCPGLVLYGRRRTGKSTILKNLNGFLPAKVLPVFISMQDPKAFTSTAHLFEKIEEELNKAIARRHLPHRVEKAVNLADFYKSLSELNDFLREQDKRVLLAIDEYENIDRKIGEQVFAEDLLATIRESIQSQRNITWIFSGSHEISELTHADWSSYLVSARTIEVAMFTPEETRLLLTKPMAHSGLKKDTVDALDFPAGFWGEQGVEYIHEQAGGWPHLVQLLAETTVDLFTDQGKHCVDGELLEQATRKSIVRGHNVLQQLMEKESVLPSEWEYLAAFRHREKQAIPADEAIFKSIRRRLLVEETNGEWKLRVPLMALWLRERG